MDFSSPRSTPSFVTAQGITYRISRVSGEIARIVARSFVAGEHEPEAAAWKHCRNGVGGTSLRPQKTTGAKGVVFLSQNGVTPTTVLLRHLELPYPHTTRFPQMCGMGPTHSPSEESV